MEYYFLFLIGLITLSIGSFLNVLINRLTDKSDDFLRDSSCPNCKVKIKWYDNIPLISWILLKGKCRACKKQISYQYPLVELFSMLVGIFIYIYYDLSYSSILIYFSLMGLMSVAIIDLKYKIVPQGLLYLSIILAMISNYISLDFVEFIDSIIYFIGAIGFFYFIRNFGEFLFNKEIMGEGDIMVFGLVSLYILDVSYILNFILISSFLTIIPLLLKTKKEEIIDNRFLNISNQIDIMKEQDKDDYLYQEKIQILREGVDEFQKKDINIKGVPFVPFMFVSLMLTLILVHTI